MATAQLRSQRHNANVVQGPVGGQNIVEGIGLKRAQVGLGVCTPLLPADKRALQVHTWEEGVDGSSRPLALQPLPLSPPAQPPAPFGHLEE